MIWNVFVPFPNTSTPVIESSAGIPVLIGFRSGLAVAFFGRRALGVCFRFDLAIASCVRRRPPHGFFNTIFVMGCTSQITGMRLFKLGGPGRAPVACVMSKNNEPLILTGTGGW
jgi:hypothetical protein